MKLTNFKERYWEQSLLILNQTWGEREANRILTRPGERGEQHANQANVIRYFEKSQGEEREEQHTNQANVVKDVKISFGFKREEQLTNQANFIGEV